MTELKQLAERGKFYPGNPWNDSLLELALPLTLLQPTLSNTLSWCQYMFLWPGLVGWWAKPADQHDQMTTRPQAVPGEQPECTVASHHHPQRSSTQLEARQPPPSILPNSPTSTAQLQCFLWPKASPNRITGLQRGKTYDHHPSYSRVPDLGPSGSGADCFILTTWPPAYSVKGSASPLCFSLAPNTHGNTSKM